MVPKIPDRLLIEIIFRDNDFKLTAGLLAECLQDKPEIQCEAVAYIGGEFNETDRISGGGGFIEWNGQKYAVAAYRADVACA